jgi:hypothetical protein
MKLPNAWHRLESQIPPTEKNAPAMDGKRPPRDVQGESDDDRSAAFGMADAVAEIGDLDDSELPQTD